ncbi:hypothetical protein Tco_1318889 [Tanacetum coccineum]
MDVTIEQWLDLIYRDHKTVDVKSKNEVVSNWLLASKFYNHKTMDQYTKNALWIYWTRGDDEVELTNEESSDPDDENLIEENEVAEIFRIETDDIK